MCVYSVAQCVYSVCVSRSFIPPVVLPPPVSFAAFMIVRLSHKGRQTAAEARAWRRGLLRSGDGWEVQQDREAAGHRVGTKAAAVTAAARGWGLAQRAQGRRRDHREA